MQKILIVYLFFAMTPVNSCVACVCVCVWRGGCHCLNDFLNEGVGTSSLTTYCQATTSISFVMEDVTRLFLLTSVRGPLISA